jgi:hypothetical protein
MQRGFANYDELIIAIVIKIVIKVVIILIIVSKRTPKAKYGNDRFIKDSGEKRGYPVAYDQLSAF